ncbi:MAG: Mevalonate kinase [Sclerophora amabilis]|nr:MAG: Mevalonate kinase [Sclerophora amabilis]
MAAAISLRSYLLVSFPLVPHRKVTLDFPDISLHHSWEIDSLPWETFSAPSDQPSHENTITSLDPELVDALESHLAKVSPTIPEDARKTHQGAAFAFLYLFLSLGKRSWPTSLYTMRSALPTGAGLGSSASVSVCISTALLLQLQSLIQPYHGQSTEEAQAQIAMINKWAFVGEMCLHGNPSGVDNTVSSGGKAVIFKRNPPHPPTVTPLRNFPELPLLLVNTKQPRSTAMEVAKVGVLKQDHPVVTDLILDAIDKVTESAHQLISSSSFNKDDPISLKHLGELNRVNHGLLVSLGVSHPKLERIRELVDHAEIGWTKLTGAGGGGCSITILKPSVEADRLKTLEASLDKEGFERYEATLGGDGVGVLDLTKSESGVKSERQTINQQNFIKSEGQEGLEALVGAGRNEDWRFWKA